MTQGAAGRLTQSSAIDEAVASRLSWVVVTPVGFEPTQLALVELESTPLDHSGKLSLVSRLEEQVAARAQRLASCGQVRSTCLQAPRSTLLHAPSLPDSCGI